MTPYAVIAQSISGRMLGAALLQDRDPQRVTKWMKSMIAQSAELRYFYSHAEYLGFLASSSRG